MKDEEDRPSEGVRTILPHVACHQIGVERAGITSQDVIEIKSNELDRMLCGSSTARGGKGFKLICHGAVREKYSVISYYNLQYPRFDIEGGYEDTCPSLLLNGRRCLQVGVQRNNG